MLIFKPTLLLLHQLRHRAETYFKLPAAHVPALPEKLLGKIPLKSWLLTSLLVSFAPYMGFSLLAIAINREAWFKSGWWWVAMLYPMLTLYLLLLQPFFWRLLNHVIDALLPLIPAIERSESLVDKTFACNRRHEWGAMVVFVVCGGWISHWWQLSGMVLKIYGLIGQTMFFATLGWTVYAAVAGTHLLTTLYSHTHQTEGLRMGAIVLLNRWSLWLGVACVGGLLLNAVFLGRYLLLPTNILLYVLFSLVVALIFVNNGVTVSVLSQVRLVRALLLFVITALGGTLGYHYFEGWNFMDGLYMTIITMTTVGFGEIGPLSQVGRIYTMTLSLISIGIAGYSISAIAAFIVEGDFQKIIRRQKMEKQIAKLNNHIVLCGVGRVGLQIAIEFYKTHTPFVMIETSLEALEEVQRLGDIPYVLGDATKDEILYLAGVERARGLIAALPDDKDNAFTVLTARSLNAKLRIVARLTDEENAGKLRKVGADEIVSTNSIGGMRMASVMLRPSVVTFLDEMLRGTGQTLRMEEMHIADNSTLLGKTLAESDVGRRTGLLVVAIKSSRRGYQFNPGAQTILQAGDILIVIGTPEQLEVLHQMSLW